MECFLCSYYNTDLIFLTGKLNSSAKLALIKNKKKKRKQGASLGILIFAPTTTVFKQREISEMEGMISTLGVADNWGSNLGTFQSISECLWFIIFQTVSITQDVGLN